MVDFLAALATGNALGPIIAQVIAPLAKNWLPADAEIESFKLRTRELKLREQEFAMRENHFVRQMAEARNNLIIQLESQRANLEDQELFRRWPLGVHAINILRESARRNSFALNVIVCIVDTNQSEFHRATGQAISHTIDMLSNHSLSIAEQAAGAFDNDMLCYRDTLRNSRLVGDSLRVTLSTLLITEPTVLIELRIPHVNKVELHVSHWGMPSLTSKSFTRYKTQTIALSPFPESLHSEKNTGSEATQQYQQILMARSITVGLALAAIIVSIGDIFRALQRPHMFSAPVLPAMMQDPTFGLRAVGVEIPKTVWQPLTSMYISTYESVASINGVLASELAAKAALAAHGAQNCEFANQLLERALHFNTQLSSPEEDRVMSILYRQRTHNKPTELETALSIIRGWSISRAKVDHCSVDMAGELGPPFKYRHAE
jgi:hypothetical protein